jgi:hypothetical protein
MTMQTMNVPIDFHIYNQLSATHLSYSKKIYAYLKTRIGKEKSKTCEDIKIKTKLFFELEDSQFRNIIQYLRLNVDARICAGHKGYYIAETEQELKEFLDSLQRRVSTQMMTIYHIQNGVLNWNK